MLSVVASWMNIVKNGYGKEREAKQQQRQQHEQQQQQQQQPHARQQSSPRPQAMEVDEQPTSTSQPVMQPNRKIPVMNVQNKAMDDKKSSDETIPMEAVTPKDVEPPQLERPTPEITLQFDGDDLVVQSSRMRPAQVSQGTTTTTASSSSQISEPTQHVSATTSVQQPKNAMVDKATRVTTRKSSQSRSRGSSAKATPKVISAMETEDDDVIQMMSLEDFCKILRVYNNKRISYKEGRTANPPEYPNPPQAFVKNNYTVDDLYQMDFANMDDPPTPLDYRFIQVDRYIPRPTKQPTPPNDDNPWPQVKLVPDQALVDSQQASTSGTVTSKSTRPKRQVTKSAEAVMESRKRTRSNNEPPVETRRKQLMTTRPEISPAPIKRTNEVAVERPQGIVETVESHSTCASGTSNQECVVVSDDSANNNSNNNNNNNGHEQTTPERHVALVELERMVTIEGFRLPNENEEPSPKTRVVEFTMEEEGCRGDLIKNCHRLSESMPMY